jgi:hypothetical protein
LRTLLRNLFLSLVRAMLVGGLVATLAVVAVYVYHLAINYRADTTAISNAAFLIAATLSALCFAWSQSLRADDDDRDRVLFSGERLLHCAVFLVIASILKYAALTLSTYEMADVAQVVVRGVSDMFGILAAILFFLAVVGAYIGVLAIYGILWSRAPRYLHSKW